MVYVNGEQVFWGNLDLELAPEWRPATASELRSMVANPFATGPERSAIKAACREALEELEQAGNEWPTGDDFDGGT